MFRARAAFAGQPEAGAIVSALAFFLAWLANPRRVGAIVPSSAALADAITADLTPASAPVIELGPGTGAFTRSIIARGIPQNWLALLESGSEFVDKLQREFPEACVRQMDAARLKHVELFGGERARRGRQRHSTAVDAGEKRDRAAGRRVRPLALGRRVLSVHLCTRQSDLSRHPRSSRASRCAHRRNIRQHPSCLRVSDPATAVAHAIDPVDGKLRESDTGERTSVCHASRDRTAPAIADAAVGY
jgi:hypothetical protein